MSSNDWRLKRVVQALVAATVILALAGAGHLDARASAGGADRASSGQLTVRLASDHRAIVAGQTFYVGLDFALADQWHVYWRNAGDSGEPPSVEWTLPEGFSAGELEWPLPERIRNGTILNYGYAKHVLLPVRIEVPSHVADTSAAITANVRWLVCRAEECIPGQARLTLDLPLGTKPIVDDESAAAFADARAGVPKARAAILDAPSEDHHIALRVPGLRVPEDAEISFFPLRHGLVEDASERADTHGTDVRVVLSKGELAPPSLERLSGVLVVESPATSTTNATRTAFAVDATPVSAAGGSLALAIVLALTGGALLNLMPCVFPVLSLKVLGFIEQAGADVRRVRLHGWVFTAGVLVSFWFLAGALIALRAGGESLGWGFQLQSPGFLACLCAVLLLLALSLSGVFEVGLSLTGVTSAHVEASRGYMASFWTGALATVIATPCTAPFMGSALGYALTRPPATALLVFTALGLGMACPYLVLSYAPKLLARLPRPGPWMESFRQLMAFPLYATVMWLLHVFSRQTSVDAMWRLMVALLLLALGAWAWGITQRARRSGRVPLLVASLAAVAALVLGFSAANENTTVDAAEPVAAADRFWQPWSPERVERLRSDGRAVFVNFTADWCLSCKINERMLFASDEVRELFRTHDVVALKADWTNEDARITEALASFGRDGVPLYVFYPAGGASPQILPQVPTHGALREAFAAAAASPRAQTIKEKNES